jgi:predicted HicB family RNase H-like nuclease
MSEKRKVAGLMVRIYAETHRELRHYAIDAGKSIRELVEDVIEDVILRKAREAKTLGMGARA